MEACGVSALLDVDGAVVERNSHHASELIAPDAPEIVFGPDVGILQREPVAMNWRLGGAAGLLQERDVSQAGALMKQVFRREVAKPEVFPPNRLFFPSVPIQHERKKPSRLLLCAPFGDIVRYAVRETRDKCGDLSLPFVEFDADLGRRRRWPIDDRAASDKIRSYRFQPIPQGLGRRAIIPIVPLDRGLIAVRNTGRIRHFEPRLGACHHPTDVLQRHGSDERIKRFEFLYRIALDAGTNSVAYDGKEIDEDLRAQQIIDLVLARRIAAHQTLHCRRFVGRKMVDVQIGIDLQALRHEVDEALERGPLLLPVRSPIANIALGTLAVRVEIAE